MRRQRDDRRWSWLVTPLLAGICGVASPGWAQNEPRNAFDAASLAQATGQPLGAVLKQRLVPVPGSDALFVLWDERRPDRSIGHWYAVSLDGRTITQARATEYKVRLRYGAFDPLTDAAPAVPAVLAAPPGGSLFLVQFVGPPVEEFRETIRALGGEVVHFMTDHTHVVRMPAGTRAQVAALPFVRWVGPLHTAYKLDGSILAMLAAGVPEGPVARYSIEAFTRTVGPHAIAGQVVALGGAVDSVIDEGFRLEATLTPGRLLQIARSDEVNFIDPWGPPGTDMNIARQIGGADYVAGFGYKGKGVRAEVMDDGLRQTHVDFQGPPPLPPPLIHGPAPFVSSHGTATYGINFGAGIGNPMGTGMLPERGQGIFATYTQLAGFGGTKTRYLHTFELVNPAFPWKAVYQSNSWGSAQTPAYTTVSAEMDDILFINDILLCQSQSNICNSQSSRPQAWAKNIVAVGGLKHLNTLTRDDDRYDCNLNSCFTGGSGASIGFASDGRIKPDLTHFYECVFTTDSASDIAYTPDFGGTSAATPITAGHFGLFYQLWHNGEFPCFGGQPTVFESRPHMSTAKAMIIHNVFQYDWNSANPNWQTLIRQKQGWGMADLKRMYDVRKRTLIVNESNVLQQFQSKMYGFNVGPGTPELRATLVYTDPKGTPGAAQHRINDLSLTVVDPTGTVTYRGNFGLTAGIWSVPGGVSDTINTVENVFVQNPAAGTWRITVSADQVVEDSHGETVAIDADYALVVSPRGLSLSCASPTQLHEFDSPTACAADCDGSGSLDQADLVCFQGKFAQGDPDADCDADGVLTVGDYTCFRDLYAAGCP